MERIVTYNNLPPAAESSRVDLNHNGDTDMSPRFVRTCTLPQRGDVYMHVTPKWPLTSGVRDEICRNVQVHPDTVMLCMVSGLATIIQGMYDVERPNGLVGPTSVATCVISEASGRKSTTDSIINKPTRRFEDKQRIKAGSRSKKASVKKLINKAKRDAYLKMIQKSVMSSPPGVMSSLPDYDIFNDFSDMMDSLAEQKISELNDQLSIENQPCMFILESITREGLYDQLEHKGASKGIISPEGLNVFTRHFSQAQSVLNSVYSGDTVTVHRRSRPSQVICDSRVSIGIGVQPGPFLSKIVGKNTGASIRDSGFASRFLFGMPPSLQGMRFENLLQKSIHFIEKHNKRMGQLLAEAYQYHLNPTLPRKVIKFSPDASEYWLRIYNAIELEMCEDGRFHRCPDHAGKLPEIIARFAAVFHCYEDLPGDISVETLDYAMKFCMHCSDNFLDIFDPPPEEVTDAEILDEWFDKYVRSRNQRHFPKNQIRQFGPHKLREKNRLNRALFTLYEQKKIDFLSWGGTNYIDVFPRKPKDNPIALEYQLTKLQDGHRGI